MTMTTDKPSVVKGRRARAEWLITVEGNYQAKVGKDISEKPYTVSVSMKQKQIDAGALSQFCKHYAPEMMPVLYPDYQALMTFRITKSECSDDQVKDNELTIMNYSELRDYIQRNEIKVDTSLYVDAGELKTAIETCEEDEPGYLKQEEYYKRVRGHNASDKLAILDDDLILKSINLNKYPEAKESKESVKAKTPSKAGKEDY